MTILNLIVSALMGVINIFRKMLSFKLEILRLHRKENSSFLTRQNVMRLTLTTILLLACPYPFLNGRQHCYENTAVGKQICYQINDYLHIAQFYKLYFFTKAFTANTIFASSSSHRICAVYGVNCSNTYVIKCMMREMPIRFILTMFVFATIFFGYAYRIVEAPLLSVDRSNDLSSYFDCCWLVVLVMTTVGYGDVYPRTLLGRLITFLVVVYGAVVVSLMVSFVTQELQMSLGELKAYAVVNRLELKNELRERSAQIINKFGQYLLITLRKNKTSDYAEKKAKILKEITDKNKDIKNLNNEYKAVSDYTPDEDMERNFIVIMDEMRDINTHLRQLVDGLDRFNSIAD